MKRIYALLSAVLVLAGLLAAPAANAQLTIGAKGGLNIPNLSAGGHDTPLSVGYSSKLAGMGGVFADYRFTKLFSLQVGLEYQGQGGQKNGLQAVPGQQLIDGMTTGMLGGISDMISNVGGFGTAAGQQLGGFLTGLSALQEQIPQFVYADSYKSVANFNYLMLPVQAKFGWRLREQSPFRVYVSVGAFVSYLISAEQVTRGSATLYLDENLQQPLSDMVKTTLDAEAAKVTDPAALEQLNGNGLDPSDPNYIQGFIPGVVEGMSEPMDFNANTNILSDLRRVNVGIIGALGVTYSFGREGRHALQLEAGGNYGFVQMQKDPVNGQNRIGAGTVSLGYSYTFGRVW